MNRKVRAYIGIIFVNIMWGLSFIGSKRSMAAGLQPFSLVMLRFAVATVFVFSIALLRKDSLKIRLRDLPLIAVTSLSGVTVYFYFELNGLKAMSAATAALIIASIPVLTMLYNYLFRKTRQPLTVWICALISLAGVYMVVTQDGGKDTLKGALLVFCACICWVIYMESSNVLLKRYSSLNLTCWQSVISLITAAPLAFCEGVKWKSVSADGWLWACVFLGLICSGICYILYNNSIRLLDTVQTAVFLNLNPLATVVGGILFLNEKLNAVQYVGGAILLISLLIMASNKKIKETGFTIRGFCGIMIKKFRRKSS